MVEFLYDQREKFLIRFRSEFVVNSANPGLVLSTIKTFPKKFASYGRRLQLDDFYGTQPGRFIFILPIDYQQSLKTGFNHTHSHTLPPHYFKCVSTELHNTEWLPHTIPNHLLPLPPPFNNRHQGGLGLGSHSYNPFDRNQRIYCDITSIKIPSIYATSSSL